MIVQDMKYRFPPHIRLLRLWNRFSFSFVFLLDPLYFCFMNVRARLWISFSYHSSSLSPSQIKYYGLKYLRLLFWIFDCRVSNGFLKDKSTIWLDCSELTNSNIKASRRCSLSKLFVGYSIQVIRNYWGLSCRI